MAEDTKDTAGGKGETLEKLSKRVTGLERELRLTKKYMRVVEARIGMTRPELEAVRKAGKASVAMLVLAGAIALVGSVVYAENVAPPTNGARPYLVAPFGQLQVTLTSTGYPGYVDSDGNLKVGSNITALGSVTATGGFYGTGVTNLATGVVLPAVAGQNVTNISAANINPLTIASAFAGQSITNIGAANLKAGGILSAVAGQSITNITAANVIGSASGITNLPAAIKIDGVAPIVAASTTKTMIQAGVGSNTQVITFSPVFTGTVRVLVSANQSATLIPYYETLTGTNVTLRGDAAVGDTITYIAIGTRP